MSDRENRRVATSVQRYRMGAGAPRTFAAALGVSLLLSLLACGSQDRPPNVERQSEVKNGVVLVFNPASCSAHRSIFPVLSKLDSIPGVTVLGLMTVAPTPDEVAEIRRAYGIAFVLRAISSDERRLYVTAVQLQGPHAWVIRRGVPESVLGVATMEKLGPELYNLFTTGT